jgi:hypothetical protein
MHGHRPTETWASSLLFLKVYLVLSLPLAESMPVSQEALDVAVLMSRPTSAASVSHRGQMTSKHSTRELQLKSC